MKKYILTISLLLSISLMSFANKPESYLSGKLVQDVEKDLVYLKLTKFNTWEEKVLVKFRDNKGRVLKIIRLKTSNYTTLKKINLEGIEFEDINIEIVRKK